MNTKGRNTVQKKLCVRYVERCSLQITPPGNMHKSMWKNGRLNVHGRDVRKHSKPATTWYSILEYTQEKSHTFVLYVDILVLRKIPLTGTTNQNIKVKRCQVQSIYSPLPPKVKYERMCIAISGKQRVNHVFWIYSPFLPEVKDKRPCAYSHIWEAKS